MRFSTHIPTMSDSESDIESAPRLSTGSMEITPKMYLTWTPADFQDSRALQKFLKKIAEIFRAYFVSGEGVSTLLHA